MSQQRLRRFKREERFHWLVRSARTRRQNARTRGIAASPVEMCPSRPPRLPGNRQLTNDRFFDILCCIFDEHLVKPRFTIDSRPNLNLNKALRIEPIRPRLGSFVHFSGFSSPLRRPVLPSPVIFFAPLPAAHNSEFTTYNPEVRAPRATAPLPIRSAKTATQLHKSFQIQQIPSRRGRSEPQAQNHKTQNASAVLSSRSPWREPPVVLETTPTFPALILLRLGPNSPPSAPRRPQRRTHNLFGEGL
jgi:hypothetical protein